MTKAYLDDNEIRDIVLLSNLKGLCIRNNRLTQNGRSTLESMNLDYLNFQNDDSDSDSKGEEKKWKLLAQKKLMK